MFYILYTKSLLLCLTSTEKITFKERFKEKINNTMMIQKIMWDLLPYLDPLGCQWVWLWPSPREDVFQQIPWFATTDTGTVDLNTSFNHGTRYWEDAKTNDQPPQQQQQTQQQTNNANSYKQKRSVVSALSSFRNINKIWPTFLIDVPLLLVNENKKRRECYFALAKFCRMFSVERRRWNRRKD